VDLSTNRHQHVCACRELLMPRTVAVDRVDIFDGISGTWSTAALSVPRASLVATSLPKQSLALFAGGVKDESQTGGETLLSLLFNCNM
jgi:hypothetical protein